MRKLLFFFCLTLLIGCKKPNDNVSSPPIDIRDKYVGYWQVHDSNTYLKEPSDYIMQITKSTVSNDFIQLVNLGDQGNDRIAIAKTAADTFNIPQQEIGTLFEGGYGSISGNSIQFTYTWYSFHIATGIKK